MTAGLFVALALPALAQELELPAPSPRARVTQQVGVVDVTVDWSSPARRGRTIWGELVPYDQLWRTGANAATTLETTGPVTIGGTAVPAGRYALFTIPGKDEWTVILNKNPDQGGTGDYDQALDLLRVQVKPETAPERERLTFLFSDTTDTGTRLDLEWAGLRVGLPITVDTPAMTNTAIAQWTKGAGSQFARAARWKAENGDLPGALELVNDSLAIEETWFNTFLKADILNQQGQHKEAYKLAQRAHELGLAAGEAYFWKDQVEKALAEWKKK